MKVSLPFTDEELKSEARTRATPFHLYDQQSIKERADEMSEGFKWTSTSGSSFRNYFAVKATPNPMILEYLHKHCGMGMDCSSLGELLICAKLGIRGEDIMFTSNNTLFDEYRAAFELGAIINIDDVSQLDCLQRALGGTLPSLLCIRFNPGPERTGNVLIGDPVEAKYGVTREQLLPLFLRAKERGVSRFGLHTMVVSNSLDMDELAETTRMMFQLDLMLRQGGITVEFLNMGGGVGVNYKPGESPVSWRELGTRVQQICQELYSKAEPPIIKYECGRCVTGDSGYLVTRVTNMKNTFKRYLGVDASMSDLMRPGMYGSYHHITVVPDEACDMTNLPPFKKLGEHYIPSTYVKKCDSTRIWDVTGSLCENNDKFAVDRELNCEPAIGDLLVIHDTGAHGFAMGFQYNAKLRHAEVLRTGKGEFIQIRRQENYEDYFGTMEWPTSSENELRGKEWLMECPTLVKYNGTS